MNTKQHKIFYSNTKSITNDSDIDEAIYINASKCYQKDK